MVVTAKCRSCGAPVIWATHVTTGKLTPLDAEPTPDGSWHTSEQLNLSGDVIVTYEHGDAGGHRSHFATCPDAAYHRNKREPA